MFAVSINKMAPPLLGLKCVAEAVSRAKQRLVFNETPFSLVVSYSVLHQLRSVVVHRLPHLNRSAQISLKLLMILTNVSAESGMVLGGA